MNIPNDIAVLIASTLGTIAGVLMVKFPDYFNNPYMTHRGLRILISWILLIGFGIFWLVALFAVFVMRVLAPIMRNI
ncbi:hypothetical protein [Asticcacaulis sp. W401b]|uniref:hypothetical protein n=1 Tax=Asticcacaulis sp. W401b TaxID=3388666 RepID=UPI0039710AE1